MEKAENFEGVRCDITMHRTLYLNQKESEEQLLDLAKKEIVLPHNALAQVASILRQTGINITGLDLKDWEVDDVKYTLCSKE